MKQNSGLDPSSPIPLYFQLQEILRKQIGAGEYKPGDLIPSEKELQERFGVSRITVRNAINGLVFEDLLVKKQGHGTMVALPRIVEDFSRLKSFTEKMRDLGTDPDRIETRVLRAKRISASERIGGHLKIPVSDTLIYIKRLRLIDGEPVAVFESYIRAELGIGEDEDFTRSIYEIFEKDHKLKIIGAEKSIEASCAQGEEAALLHLQEGDSTLIIRHTTFAEGNLPIEYAEGVYRADRYKYVVRLKR